LSEDICRKFMNGQLVVLGASGFLGRHLIEGVRKSGGGLRAVTRQPNSLTSTAGVEWIQADLTDATSLERALRSDDTVLNLAFMPSAGMADNLAALDNLISVCSKRGVKRLIHCSTAMVAGSTRVHTIDEATECRPVTSYERCKLALEQRLLAEARSRMEVVILRPTAIIGPGGANLVSLARSLLSGSPVLSYVRRSVFGNRPMHLVPVSTVVSAILHVAQLPSQIDGETFYVSADDDPDNRFAVVERILRSSLGLPPFQARAIPVPPGLLSVALCLRGRSDVDPARIYLWNKLRHTGFSPKETLADAIHDFGTWFLKSGNRPSQSIRSA
jgi:nucleoside-diphosphate-sugar epimerase